MLSLLPPLRVALLTSHRAPGLDSLVSDPLHGVAYTVVGAISSEETFQDGGVLGGAGIPFAQKLVRAFHRERGAKLSDVHVREAFDRELAECLARWAPDVVLCCGYLYLLTAPVLTRWPGAVFSVHHSDMLDRDARGAVRYPGLRAVRDAVAGGEVETRSTVHLVTESLDAGPAVIRSWGFPVPRLACDARRWGATDMLKAYAFAHQEWMLRKAWGPLMARTLELASLDRGGLDGSRPLLGAPWDLAEDGRMFPARTSPDLSGPRRPSPDLPGPSRTAPDLSGPPRTAPDRSGPPRTAPDRSGPPRTSPDLSGPPRTSPDLFP